MFSKKFSTQPAAPASAARESFLAGVPANRYTALAGAALLFAAAAGGLLAATGNPHDGAPVVRAPILAPAGGVGGWRSALGPEDASAASSLATADGAAPAGADGVDGEAVILMPGAGQDHAQPLAQAPIAGL